MAKNMIIHDVSMTLIENMVAYPKDVPYRRRLQRDLDLGDSSSVSVMESSVHVGTHLDAPRHFYPAGFGVEKIPLDRLYGPAFVADCRHAPAVTADMLTTKVPPHTRRLLLKTDNSQFLHDNPLASFNETFVYLDKSGAQFCLDLGLKLVAIDYLSIDRFGSQEKPAHRLLLGNNIIIVEGVVLAEVEQGEYFLACGPLKMAHSDGAPCRAVLIENLI